MEKSKLFFDPAAHTYSYDGRRVPSVSQILLDEGFINTTFFTEEGRSRGSAVHKAIEVHCRGAHCFHSPAIDPYLNAFKNFIRDCDWVSEIVEQPLGCIHFAGTPDVIGTFQGNKAILDIKTGSISVATGLQLVAYEKLFREVVDTEKVVKIIKRFALQVTDTGRYILTEYKDRTDRHIWDSAVAIWHWKRNNKIKQEGIWQKM